MARPSAAFLLLAFALCVAAAASPALARKRTRRLNGGYPKSGSSPVLTPPYTPTPSGSSPTPIGNSPTPSGSSPTPSSGNSPLVTPPLSPTPPVSIPPVVSTPTGGYGGYGSRSGMGTSGFFGRNPGRIPRILSLVSSLVKLFGPRLLKFFANRKPPTLLGALKTESNMPIDALSREASASLINTYAYNDFPLSTADVVEQFNAALESPELVSQQALKFQQLNEGV